MLEEKKQLESQLQKVNDKVGDTIMQVREMRQKLNNAAIALC